jgi:hypothetical protein
MEVGQGTNWGCSAEEEEEEEDFTLKVGSPLHISELNAYDT